MSNSEQLKAELEKLQRAVDQQALELKQKNRELEIEAALERVRARTMAMQKSDELSQVVAVIYEEINRLGFSDWGCSIIICDTQKSVMRYWYAETNMPHLEDFCNVPLTNKIVKKTWEFWQSGIPQFDIELLGKEKEDYTSFMLNSTDYSWILPEEVKKGWLKPKDIYLSYFSLKYGMLEFVDIKPLNRENYPAYERFTNVFEQTYTRFLDLQKAEALAKEAQIELSLEKVRAKTIAMHTSQDVAETVLLLFNELVELGLERNARCGIGILDDSTYMELWTASKSEDGKVSLTIGKLDMTLHPLLIGARNAWVQKKAGFTYVLEGQDLIDYYTTLSQSKEYAIKVNLEKLPERDYHTDFTFPDGLIFAFTKAPISEEVCNIFRRFAALFGQTYRRYLDLLRAEAQAKEAQIEAALERVRSKSLSMHSSSELQEVINLVNLQLKTLGVDISGGAFITMNKTIKEKVVCWGSGGTTNYLDQVIIPYLDRPIYSGLVEGISKGPGFFTENYSEEEKMEFFRHLFNHHPFKNTPESYKQEVFARKGGYARSCAVSDHTSIFIINHHGKKFSDHDNKILQRMGRVFDQAYARFLDIQKAEAQARDAIKQASLDRVRGEIASMRTTDDLDRITPLMWKELKTLGISFIRCGVFIMDEVHNKINTYLSTPEGKAIAAFQTRLDDTGNFSETIQHWKKQERYVSHWGEKEFKIQANDLVNQGAISSEEEYLKTIPEGGFYLHFSPFPQGMLYVGSLSPLDPEDLKLIQALADAFSVAYARYEDFNRLEAAKKEVDKTLSDLKQTQLQLVQSEKMASLGELTAGIAHEIQNPLNFVNNFSEVSAELIDEAQGEIEKGDLEEIKYILQDLKDNLTKINHHGKRAGSIVKGMLEHSRKSEGKKELTDLNQLADECLRLSFHGLRAKDKTFQADFKTELDPNLPKLQVVSQDLGRVFLNLINNAFYAANERLRHAPPNSGFKPEVIVCSKLNTSGVEISVKDNGTGIPDSIKEKIFQPFFTTKPTGSGTGLGLSLSYDIVKAHRGELKVSSREGEGTLFSIFLPTSTV